MADFNIELVDRLIAESKLGRAEAIATYWKAFSTYMSESAEGEISLELLEQIELHCKGFKKFVLSKHALTEDTKDVENKIGKMQMRLLVLQNEYVRKVRLSNEKIIFKDGANSGKSCGILLRTLCAETKDEQDFLQFKKLFRGCVSYCTIGYGMRSHVISEEAFEALKHFFPENIERLRKRQLDKDTSNQKELERIRTEFARLKEAVEEANAEKIRRRNTLKFIVLPNGEKVRVI